ncbi:hypothetical protein [Tsuneonella amylolytica]|uniref:hypothetical protein n=1 Tax=Tsuneonella amylolytica TaxID=2338327 RepID=UPI000EA86CC4|nr:hypothetical protein [Tsuneonella amylolytica]
MRNIIWADEFTGQVKRAGGARIVDEALSPIIDGLMRNPYGFPKVENDWTSFRYAKTDAILGKLGALTVVFTIDDDKNVVLEWLDEDIPF